MFLIFFICLRNQSYSIHSILTYQRVKIFEKDDNYSIGRKWTGLLFGRLCCKIFISFCFITEEHSFLEVSFLKTAERALKHSTRHFKNKSLVDRLACSYVSVTGNFGRFQYFNFEKNFLKNENFFQKTGVPFLFRWKY